MLKMFSSARTLGLAFVLAASLSSFSVPAQAVDWSSVNPLTVKLFYPGQTSIEWMYHKRRHDGAAKYRKRKKACDGCHDGDEAKYGKKIVAGGEDEPTPLPGRIGYREIEVKAAYDADNLYIRLKWPQAQPLATPQDNDYHTKVSMMFDDQTVEEFTYGGCWAVCHADAKKMEKDGDKKKYLAESRTEMHKFDGGAENYRPDAELQGLMDQGVFVEFWQARLNPGQPAEAMDGYILKDRTENDTPAVQVDASQQGNDWVVEFSRPLQAGANHKHFVSGKTYVFGVSLHDQRTEGRFHLTSLQFELALDGGDVDLVARKQ